MGHVSSGLWPWIAGWNEGLTEAKVKVLGGGKAAGHGGGQGKDGKLHHFVSRRPFVCVNDAGRKGRC